MRMIVLSLCGLVLACAASAQISLGVNGDYTMYKGDFGRSTPGFGVRAAYEQDRYAATLYFTNGFAISDPGSVTVYSATGNTKTVASKIKYNFKSIGLIGLRTLIGDAESTGKLYGGFGASYVFVKYSEVVTESYDKNTYTAPEMEKGSENGFTLNAALGGQYKIGRPALFAEAGLAYPANQVGDSYLYNAIPLHFTFNVGVKFSLGGNE